MFYYLMRAEAADLSASDYKALLDAIQELYRIRNLPEYPRITLQLLRQLIPCSFASYNELNLRTRQVVMVFEPEEVRERGMKFLPLLAKYEQQHPLMMQYHTTGAGAAQKISDFVSWEELQGKELYRECLSKVGVGDSLSFSVQSSTFTLIFFVLNQPEPLFSERDRTVANLIRPHLAQAFENAEAYTEAKAIAALSLEAVTALKQGLIITDQNGHIRHVTEHAGELLDRYFSQPTDRLRMLPAAVKDWLGSVTGNELRPPAPFRLLQSNRTLKIRCALDNDGHLLLLEECGEEATAQRLVALGLSQREAEVLFWLTQGKSNEEIGMILGISPRTVGKHVENIYNKLGVQTRAGAMLAAVPLLRHEL